MCFFSNLEVQLQTTIYQQTFNQWLNANLGGLCCGNIMEVRNQAHAALEKIAKGNTQIINRNYTRNKHGSTLQPPKNNSCTFRLERLQVSRKWNPSRQQSHDRQKHWPTPARNRCYRHHTHFHKALATAAQSRGDPCQT